MRWPFITIVILLASGAYAQERQNWDALAQLQPGDKVHVTLKTRGAVTADFRSWTPDEITAGNLTAHKQDV